MASNRKKYRKLPGKSYWNSLWLAEDHLLSVENREYSESYKRFYFNDIQAIICRRTRQLMIENTIALLVAVAFLAVYILIGLSAEVSGDAATALIKIASFIVGIILLGVLINALLGPRCQCTILTAVQSEPLPSLKRIRTFRKALARLTPHIQQAQGVLTQEQMQQQLHELETSPPTRALPQRTVDIDFTVKRTCNGRIHQFLFYLLLLDTIHTAARISLPSIAIGFAGIILFILLSTALVMALAKQRGSDLSQGIKTVTWFVLVYMFWCMIMGTLLSLYVTFQNPEISNNSWRLFIETSSFEVLDSPPLLSIMLFSILCALALALTGSKLLQDFRKKLLTPPPLPPKIPPTPAAEEE